MKIKAIILFLSIALTGFFVACSDWTKQESMEIENPSIEDVNPLSYQQYLDNLRNYKQTYHPLLIGIFDNSDKTFKSRAGRTIALPDKVDVVSLMYPDDLADIELEDMSSIQEKKGTKVIYTIAYEALRKSVELRNFDIEIENLKGKADAEANGTSFVPIPLLDITVEATGFMDIQLALLDKYEYDGFILQYDGKATHFMKDKEIEDMQTLQNIIFGKTIASMNAHPGKLFILEGRPQNVLNKSILLQFNNILFSTGFVTGITDVTLLVKQALLDPAVPSNNILVCASPYYKDENEYEWGSIVGADGSQQSAIVEMALWVKTPDVFTKAGVAVNLINQDYFNPDLDYKNVREAIEIMNPSPKN
jgi:hypothetical protein